MRGPLYPFVYGYKFTTANIPSMAGKVIVVTGGNAGIGLETTRELFNKGAKIYIACRSQQKAEEAIKNIKETALSETTGEVLYLPLDLMSFASVRQFATQFSAAEERLDVLINNAGIMAVDYKLTKDGCDQQLQTNHLSPFLLTHLLMPKLSHSGDPRIVNVSSIAHARYFKNSPDNFESFEHVNGELGGPWPRYGQSKISNILFANELAKRHPSIMSNSCHPGIIDTGLYSHLGVMSTFMNVFATVGAFLRPADGALTQLYLATSTDIRNHKITGKYYVPLAKASTPSDAVNDINAERLWGISEKVFAERNITLTL
ncbi:protein of unknown function [Taphrina deformans PYCC 5710]|uniref:Short-chain dehydrogenase n=1 Tax=Taphrina deformans (strain PYCC 5710 / ATCC 11124 / CBS 356.35 / IMI 108563 / JCM 9778 / NBRC 8474) TaxID=1097556 RepID=R4XD99_TAPDE|nr:protein of unknown function [Taphrina deformans PYCC 5710]|eukprot:CCG83805.1 protein of unknown function [Taphrina deformans PYCC 5710]